jgi:hypothetical protein
MRAGAVPSYLIGRRLHIVSLSKPHHQSCIREAQPIFELVRVWMSVNVFLVMTSNSSRSMSSQMTARVLLSYSRVTQACCQARRCGCLLYWQQVRNEKT